MLIDLTVPPPALAYHFCPVSHCPLSKVSENTPISRFWNSQINKNRLFLYRGTRPPGLQGPPRAGRPGPGWGRRRGDGRRAPPAAAHIPGSSCSRPAPGAPPVGIGVVARDRHMVWGTAGHTPAETETSLSQGHSRWAVRPSRLTPSLPGCAV